MRTTFGGRAPPFKPVEALEKERREAVTDNIDTREERCSLHQEEADAMAYAAERVIAGGFNTGTPAQVS